MKILICYPWLDLGGAPNTALTLAKGLKERGHDVFFFTKPGGLYESRLHEAGITLIDAPFHRFLPHLFHLNHRAYRIMCEAIEREQIDIVHAFHPHSYYLALFAAPPLNVPVVFTAVWYLMPVPFPAYRGRVVFVAEEFRDQAARYFRNYPREIAVIPNRIDLGMYHPDVDHTRFREEHRLTASGWKLAFMSRIDHSKLGSLRHAVDAMGILASRGREVVLAIAGGGTMYENLSRYVDWVNGQVGREVVLLLGPVLETPQFLSWADVVLGIGRCAWEGMACGKPTLVVGENGFAGVVEPGSVDELAYYNFAGRNRNSPADPALLADTIERIMSGGGDYRRLSQFAREYVLERYDYRTGAERLERMYEAALGDPPLGRGERVRLKLENVLFGYGCRALVAWRLKLRGLIGRGRPEDGLHVDVVQD